MIRYIRNSFRLKRETKDRTIEDVRSLLENYDYFYESIKTKDALSKNYIELESNSNRYKNLSTPGNLHEIRSYLKYLKI